VPHIVIELSRTNLVPSTGRLGATMEQEKQINSCLDHSDLFG